MFTTLLFSVNSCSYSKAYHHFETIPQGVWHRQQAIRFVVDTPSITSKQLWIKLVYSPLLDYPAIDLEIEHYGKNQSSPPTKDTVQIKLIDSKGIPLGDGQGFYYQLKHKHPLTIIKDSSTYINIKHLMPTLLLNGIEKIGLEIDENHHCE